MSILSAACTKELKYSKEELLAKAVAADPTATVILPRSMEEGVSCDAYTAGCLSAHTVKVKELDLIAVEYATQDQAIAGAKKFRGYYTRNWLLDDVAGEPILERFATEILKAEKP
ncbi:MAG TPA: hypothetical protein VNJ01_09470 [Bacteriovoracaceae bacterium]|nr:hypothetical protein [Bacteriovoracaceae bacterium]